MTTFFALVISGCISGVVYSVLAVGLVVEYSTSRIFNFGHGALAFATAYVYFQLNSGFGLSVPIAFILSIFIFAPLCGLIWDRLVFRNLQGADETPKVVCGIGMLLVMPALIQFIGDVLRVDFHAPTLNTATAYGVPGIGPNPPHNFDVFTGLIVSSDEIIIVAVGLAVCGACWALLNFTRIGLTMRAAVDVPKLAELRSVDTRRVSSIAWLQGSLLAGIVGVIAAPIVGAFGLVSDNYTFALFVALIAVVIARMRSIPIAFVAAILIGALRNLSVGYLTPVYLGSVGQAIENLNGLSGSAPYLFLILALIWAGRKQTTRIAGTSSALAPPPDYLADLPRWRRAWPWIIATAVVMGFALGPANQIWRELIISGFALGIVFLSFTLMAGVGGIISLAQASFAGLGALTAGYLINQGWPFIPSLLAATAICVVGGVLFALPGLRLGGLPLAFMTLGLALIVSDVILGLPSLDNDGSGWTFNRPAIGSFSFASDRAYLVLVFVVLVIAATLVHRVTKSPTGRAIIAVRAAEPAAVTSGVSPTAVRLTIFAFGAALAAVGGILWVEVQGQVQGTTFTPELGFLWLAGVVIFGVNRPVGAVVAGLMASVVPYFLEQGIHIGSFGWNGTGLGGYTSTYLPEILFGLAAVGLSKHPYGALSQTAETLHRRRVRRQEAAGGAASATPRPNSGAVTREREEVPTVAVDAPAALSVIKVSAGYGEAEILHDVSFSVDSGSTFAIIGANGAGKSTLAAVLGGQVALTDGQVLLKGSEISTLRSFMRPESGLVVIPESRGIFPGLTVEENLRIWLPKAEDHEQVYERFSNLAKRRRVAAGNLSGGEQQMLSLAPFFVRVPRVLVVDEPTLGLSPTMTATVADSLIALREEGVAVVLIEEKASAVFRIASRVAAMADGRIRWVRDIGDLKLEDVEAAYMGEELNPA